MEMTAAICAEEDVPAIAYEETVETTMDIVLDQNDNFDNTKKSNTEEYLANLNNLASLMFPDTLVDRELEMLAKLANSIGPDKMRKLCLVGVAAGEKQLTSSASGKRKCEPDQDQTPADKMPKLEVLPVQPPEKEKLQIKKRHSRTRMATRMAKNKETSTKKSTVEKARFSGWQTLNGVLISDRSLDR